MSLFETVLQEKPPVVLEVGRAYTKLGFAAEAHPRFIIPSIVNVSTAGLLKKLFDYDTESILYDQIVDFLQMIFFKHVLCSPKDRKIVIVESIFCPTIIRQTFAKVLFKHFEVSSLLFIPNHLVVLSTLAIDSAVVVDLGYSEASVIPVYSGTQILSAFEAQAFGAEDIHKSIKMKLIKSGVKADYLTETVIEDIKIRTCFVTTIERARKYRNGMPPSPPPSVEYYIKEKEIIVIPGEVRETAYEVLFPDDNDCLGLPYMILNAILKCPLDMRKILTENILLIGGTAIVMGLLARLKSELLEKLEECFYKDKFFVQTFKFHRILGKENFAAWLGGSIYGGTDLVMTRSLTKEIFLKSGRVPDWTNLEDNRGPGS